MKRFLILATAALGLGFTGFASSAEAQHYHGGYSGYGRYSWSGSRYGSGLRPYGYSSRSYYGYRNYGHSHYGHGLGHYDYHPPTVIDHGSHYHYIPGHLHYHYGHHGW